MRVLTLLVSISLLASTQLALAEILPEAQVGIKIPLIKKPTTRPMTVAHIPALKRYYIADGGLAPMGGMKLLIPNPKFMLMMRTESM